MAYAPLAEVGFLCGYADQAHFTREFRRRVGLPPERYRRAFASGPSETRLRTPGA